jgi:pSer/pThr/pTyr-binding forkhead associated (FHA) protein
MSSSSVQTPALLVPQAEHAGKPPLPLNRPVVIIGSGRAARVQLRSDSVSNNHLLFVQTTSGAYIRDLASRTHTILNGRVVREAPLRDGDTLTIGAFIFKYRVPEGFEPQPRVAPEAASLDAGAEFPLPLETRTVLIGRRRGCDVMLEDESVSISHAVIFESDGHHYIMDLASRTGTFVNGERVKESPLKIGDEIRIGESAIWYRAADAINLLEELDAQTRRISRPASPALPAVPDNAPGVSDLVHLDDEIDPLSADASATYASHIDEALADSISAAGAAHPIDESSSPLTPDDWPEAPSAERALSDAQRRARAIAAMLQETEPLEAAAEEEATSLIKPQAPAEPLKPVDLASIAPPEPAIRFAKLDDASVPALAPIEEPEPLPLVIEPPAARARLDDELNLLDPNTIELPKLAPIEEPPPLEFDLGLSTEARAEPAAPKISPPAATLSDVAPAAADASRLEAAEPLPGIARVESVSDALAQAHERALHEEKGFPHEQKALPHEQKSLPHEEKSFLHEEKGFPHEQKAPPHEQTRVPREEKSFLHEEKALPREEKSLLYEAKGLPQGDESLLRASETSANNPSTDDPSVVGVSAVEAEPNAFDASRTIPHAEWMSVDANWLGSESSEPADAPTMPDAVMTLGMESGTPAVALADISAEQHVPEPVVLAPSETPDDDAALTPTLSSPTTISGGVNADASRPGSPAISIGGVASEQPEQIAPDSIKPVAFAAMPAARRRSRRRRKPSTPEPNDLDEPGPAGVADDGADDDAEDDESPLALIQTPVVERIETPDAPAAESIEPASTESTRVPAEATVADSMVEAPVQPARQRVTRPAATRRRTGRATLILIATAGLSFGTWSAVQQYLPVPATIDASMTFDGLEKLDQSARESFLADQRQRLRNARESAAAAMASTVGAGFLTSGVDFEPVTRGVTWNESRPSVVLITLPSDARRTSDDLARFTTLLDELWTRNQDLVVEDLKARELTRMLEADVVAQQAQRDRLAREIETLRSANEQRPTPAQMRAAEENVRDARVRADLMQKQLDRASARVTTLEERTTGSAGIKALRDQIDTERARAADLQLRRETSPLAGARDRFDDALASLSGEIATLGERITDIDARDRATSAATQARELSLAIITAASRRAGDSANIRARLAVIETNHVNAPARTDAALESLRLELSRLRDAGAGQLNPQRLEADIALTRAAIRERLRTLGLSDVVDEIMALEIAMARVTGETTEQIASAELLLNQSSASLESAGPADDAGAWSRLVDRVNALSLARADLVNAIDASDPMIDRSIEEALASLAQLEARAAQLEAETARAANSPELADAIGKRQAAEQELADAREALDTRQQQLDAINARHRLARTAADDINRNRDKLAEVNGVLQVRQPQLDAARRQVASSVVPVRHTPDTLAVTVESDRRTTIGAALAGVAALPGLVLFARARRQPQANARRRDDRPAINNPNS